jgi:GxxExxY protein
MWRDTRSELRAIFSGAFPADNRHVLRVHWDLTEAIIGAAIEVHRALGPGLLESIYRDALALELRLAHLTVLVEHDVPVYYRGHRIRNDLRIDMLVNGLVVVEIKAVERLHPVHQAQVITYLKLTGAPIGLLFNFNSTTIRSGMKRLEHPDGYTKTHSASAAEKVGDGRDRSKNPSTS